MIHFDTQHYSTRKLHVVEAAAIILGHSNCLARILPLILMAESIHAPDNGGRIRGIRRCVAAAKEIEIRRLEMGSAKP
jgi:hypothetical protein